MKDREGSEMGGFTRILHSGEPDHVMDEIPTFVVDPLPAGVDKVRDKLLRKSLNFVQTLFPGAQGLDIFSATTNVNASLVFISKDTVLTPPCSYAGICRFEPAVAFQQWLEQAQIEEE